MSMERWGTRDIYMNTSVRNFCILGCNQQHLEMFRVRLGLKSVRKHTQLSGQSDQGTLILRTDFIT